MLKSISQMHKTRTARFSFALIVAKHLDTQRNRTMSIYKKYQEYAISIVGRKNGYITQAEREKARKKNRKKKKK
jgi:hypothetical protein